MRRRGLAVTALVIAATAACTAEAPVPASPTPTPTSVPTATASPDATPSPTPSQTQGPSGVELPAVGTPFDAATVLTAMRDSRRPGGVPDQLETDAIASALAAATWTFDGQPWTTMAVSGSCGPEACTVELAGARPGSHGDDVWIFEVRPAQGLVSVTSAELRGMPNELLPSLDELARSLAPPATLDGLLLTSARWLAPPEIGRFALAYRGEGEEGSCSVDLTLDAVTPRIFGHVPLGC